MKGQLSVDLVGKDQLAILNYLHCREEPKGNQRSQQTRKMNFFHLKAGGGERHTQNKQEGASLGAAEDI